MARLQILELPEGSGDERPPFALVLDQVPDLSPLRGETARIAQLVVESGARAFLVTAETVEIPANDMSAEFRAGLQETVGEMYESARQSLSESETLGHKLLQRAENAEGRSRAMEVQRDRAAHRAEQAEAGRVAADNVLRAVCEVFGGPHQDPVVKAREVLGRAAQAEEKLTAFTERSRRRDVERMDAITDALGIDRLRDWGEIVKAIKTEREGGHRFRVPGYLDPQRCAECGLDRHAWMFGSDRRTCNEVQAKEAG
jgi:hypothetical protein